MKRLVWVVLFILILAAAALVGTLEYLNRSYLPGQGKLLAERTVSEALGRKATVGRIHAGLLSGVVLQEVTVEEDPRFGEGPFLQIDQISGKVLFLPFLKSRQIVIPSIRIVRPRIQILQDLNGRWNVQSIRIADRPGAAPPKLSVLIPRTIIEDALVRTSFRSGRHWVKLNFSEGHADLRLSLPAKAQWSVRAKLSDEEGAGSAPISLKLDGSYDHLERQISLKSGAQLPLESIARFLPDPDLFPFASLEGSGSVEINATGPLPGPYTLRGSLQTQGLHWKLSSGVEGDGEIEGSLRGSVPPLGSPNPWKGLEAAVHLNKVHLRSVPAIGELQRLSGEITVRPDGLRAERLTANLATGEPLTLSGALDNNEKQTFTVRAETTLPLQPMPAIAPLEVQTFALLLKLNGEAAVEAAGEGQLKPAFSFRPTVSAKLRNLSLEVPEFGAVKEGAGSIRWQPDLLSVPEMKGKFRDLPFQIQGSLVNFAHPEIDSELKWGPLAVELKASVEGERAKIEALSGRYGDVQFRVLGELESWKNPVGNLYGETTVNLAKLPGLIPNPPLWLTQYPFQGTFSTHWTQKGPLLDPARWEFRLKGTSQELKVLLEKEAHRELTLENVALDVEHAAGLLTLHSLTLGLFGGRLEAAGVLKNADPEKPWSGKVQLREVDVASLAKSFNWKTQNLSGRLRLDLQAEAPLKAPAAARGQGSVRVAGGEILELPFLGNFAEKLNVPSLKKIAFQEAEGPFTLERGAIHTQSFRLIGSQGTLTFQGSGGFTQGIESPIDWRVLPALSPEAVPEEARSKIGQVIAQGATYLIGEIRVTGTWKNPKSVFLPKPITQILNDQLFKAQDALNSIF